MKYSLAIFLFLAFVAGTVTNNSKLFNNTVMAKYSTAQSSEVLSPTQIALFEHVNLTPGQKISSTKIDVRKYSTLSIFLKATNGENEGSSGITKASCYYLPDGEDHQQN